MGAAGIDSRRSHKTVGELEVDDWFVTSDLYAPGLLISWIVLEPPEDRGGAAGWACKATPLCNPDGSWPHPNLGTDPQWVRFADIYAVLGVRDLEVC
jgi:hypothetical protein